MGKINKKSLKWTFALYIIPCVIISMIGILMIGHGTNYIQELYLSTHSSPEDPEAIRFEINFCDNVLHYTSRLSTREESIIYMIISNAQVVLIPMWTILCVAITGLIFYNIELKKPIKTLMDASRKISENQLDFQIRCKKKNELGMLCDAFEDMRMTLYENNKEMWKSLEERKRLNSAFSHDLRTPLTVLKGYIDFLQQYLPDGKVNEEKLMNVLSMMNGQIVRLEHYTQKMNTAQKLEDIIPDIQSVSAHSLSKDLIETGKLLCGDKAFDLSTSLDYDNIYIDSELVVQVYENLISNAVRYAENKINAAISVSGVMMKISVSDDGRGFTETALKNADKPFFRDQKESDTHFGLGLYICRVLCEKHGGKLKISNHENGGIVTAEFFCEKI